MTKEEIIEKLEDHRKNVENRNHGDWKRMVGHIHNTIHNNFEGESFESQDYVTNSSPSKDEKQQVIDYISDLNKRVKQGKATVSS